MMRWENGPPPCVVCKKPGFRVRTSDNLVVCRDHDDVTLSPEEQAEVTLRGATSAGLLRTFAALTHRLNRLGALSPEAHEVRSQRLRVEREILRRMT